jgi:hypothetical protein
MINIVILLLILVFLAGFIVLLNNGIKYDKTPTPNGCPNLLVRKGNKLSLLNSNAKFSPGSNPMIFDNLNNYKGYLEKQKQNGLSCPVLYIQEENDVQGNDVYKMFSNPFEIDNGLMTMNLVTNIDNMENQIDLSGNQGPFNTNQYPSFDPQGLNIGKYTSIDAVHDSTMTQNSNKISDNAMDSNWGGVIKTEQVVASGKYIENEVNKITYPKMYPKNL